MNRREFGLTFGGALAALFMPDVFKHLRPRARETFVVPTLVARSGMVRWEASDWSGTTVVGAAIYREDADGPKLLNLITFDPTDPPGPPVGYSFQPPSLRS